ncbi:hypothetical protein ACF0H5_003226 [Mactra antiquata]
MQVAGFFYQILCGCSIVVCVLGHSLSNRIHDRTDEKRQLLRCNNLCPFGYVSDVEGELTCTCYHPCSVVLCLQSTVCVPEMPKDCVRPPCRAEGVCREGINSVQTHTKDDHRQLNWPDVSENVQRDDPKLLWPIGNDDNLCSQPLPMAAVDCRHKRRRWHFNSLTGKCERFLGCDTFEKGNNFARKRFCKEECRYAYIEKRDRLRSMMKTENAPSDCNLNLSEEAFLCSDPTKRWYFNSRTQRCERFIGCNTTGNNFLRKSDCKSTCMAKTKQFLHLKEKHLEESSAR